MANGLKADHDKETGELLERAQEDDTTQLRHAKRKRRLGTAQSLSRVGRFLIYDMLLEECR